MTDGLKDERRKNVYLMDDVYLNGWARICGWKASLVYMSLCRHADKYRVAFPSYKLMAEEHGLSESTIKRGVADLIRYNIVKKSQKKSLKGKFLHNTYTMTDKKLWKKTVGLHRPAVNRRSPQTSTVGLHRPHKDTHNKDTHTLSREISKKYGSIKNIEEQDLISISETYSVPLPFVRSKLDDLVNWHESSGKTKKNWLATLRNWVKTDAIKLRREEHGHGSKRAIDASKL